MYGREHCRAAFTCALQIWTYVQYSQQKSFFLPNTLCKMLWMLPSLILSCSDNISTVARRLQDRVTCARSTFLSVMAVERCPSLGSSFSDSQTLLNREYHSKTLQRLKQTSSYVDFIIWSVSVALFPNLK